MGELAGVFGRDSEQRTLVDALDCAEADAGNAILVSGEAGIGKTALIDAIKATAAARGFKVFAGAASADSLRPLLAFSRALGENLATSGSTITFSRVFAMDVKGALVASAVRGAEAGDGAIAGMLTAIQSFVRDSFNSDSRLGRLEYGGSTILAEHGEKLSIAAIVEGREHPDMPMHMRRALRAAEAGDADAALRTLLEEKFASSRALEGANLENERIRVAEEVVRRLREAAPALLILEDVHWADESSLSVLGHAARGVKKESALVVATLRPRESQRAASLASEMTAQGTAKELALGPLDEAAVKSILDGACSPNDFPKEFAAELASRCGGNPFFVKETVRHMFDSGGIAVRGGAHVIANKDYRIPDSLEGVVQARLSSLEPDAMALAEYASCIGRSFDAEAVRSLAFVQDAETALKALEDGGIVARAKDRAEFCHAVFQDSIYKGINPSWKSRHHKSLGEYLERKHAGDLDSVIYELARHFSKAPDNRKAYDYCSKAGSRAAADFAPAAAAEFYEGAISRIPQLGRQAVSEAEEVALMERLGEAAMLSGQISKAKDVFKKAAESATEAHLRARMLRKLADTLTVQGKLDDALAGLDEAEKLAENIVDTKESGSVSIARSYIHLSKGDYSPSLEFANAGIGKLAAYGDFESQRLVAKAWKIIGVCHLLKGEHEASLASYGKALEIGERINDPYGVSASYNNIGNVYLYKGEFDEAVGYYQKALEIDEKTGDLQAVSYALNNMGLVHKNKGRFEEALRCYERCLDIAERVGEPQGQSSACNNIGNVMSELGKDGDALEKYTKSLAISEKAGDRQLTANNLCAIAGSLIGLGRLSEAEEANAKAAAIAKDIGTKGNALWAARNAAVIATLKGEWVEAEKGFAGTTVGFREIKMEAEAAKTELDHAECLFKKGDAGAALIMLDKSQKFFESSGMAPQLKKCAVLRAQIDGKRQ